MKKLNLLTLTIAAGAALMIPSIARAGIIGDARGASAEHGHAIVSRVVGAVEPMLRQLLGNQQAR